MFKVLPASALRMLCERMEKRTFKEGETLAAQGETANEMFVVYEGGFDVEVTKKGEEKAIKVCGRSPCPPLTCICTRGGGGGGGVRPRRDGSAVRHQPYSQPRRVCNGRRIDCFRPASRAVSVDSDGQDEQRNFNEETLPRGTEYARAGDKPCSMAGGGHVGDDA
eukprot:1644883-Prymnesium_polylepis.2